MGCNHTRLIRNYPWGRDLLLLYDNGHPSYEVLPVEIAISSCREK